MPEIMKDLGAAADRVARTAAGANPTRAVLVAISGIDASGKGALALSLAQQLQARGLKTALIALDPWHEPQSVRFSSRQPAEHFYTHAFRWDELFASLILPLKQNRSVTLTTTLIEIAQDKFYSHTYRFENVDVILLEGIFLLKRDLRSHYDLAFWVECSFDAALRRAVMRNQEGADPWDIVKDYQTIYFPAQRVHFEKDAPLDSADLVYLNEKQPQAP